VVDVAYRKKLGRFEEGKKDGLKRGKSEGGEPKKV